MPDDTELVLAVRSGQPEAFGQLVDRYLDRCWEVAWRILHDRDLAADIAQDTLLVAWRQLDRLEQPGSFGGWVLRIARNRAIDRLERERRAIPVDDHDRLEPTMSGERSDDPAAIAARSDSRDVVWAAAAALGERDASLLDLHLRHGLEPHEIAQELEIAPNAAHQALFRLRKRLGTAVEAWLVWRGGHPRCVVLAAELAAAEVEAFGAEASRVVQRHVAECEGCAQERDRSVAPAALFSAAPLVAAPASLRTEMISALRDQGVPVGAGSGGSAPGTRSTAASAPTDRDTGSGRRRDDPGSPPGPRPDRDGRRSRVPVALGSLVVVAVLLTIALLRPGAEPDLVTIDHDEEASSAPTSDTGVGGSSPPATAADAPSSTEAGPVDGDLTAPSSLDGAASQADTGPTTAHSEPQVTQTEPPLPGPPVADPPDTTRRVHGAARSLRCGSGAGPPPRWSSRSSPPGASPRHRLGDAWRPLARRTRRRPGLDAGRGGHHDELVGAGLRVNASRYPAACDGVPTALYRIISPPRGPAGSAGAGRRRRRTGRADRPAGSPPGPGARPGAAAGLVLGVGHRGVDAGDDVGPVELVRRLELAPVEVDGLVQGGRREVGGEAVGEAQHGGDLGPEQRRAQDVEGHVGAGAGDGVHARGSRSRR
jgi:RNA polymerase sigma factor (sigma-70 family)